MKKPHPDSKILMGALILGIGAIAIFLMLRKKPIPLERVGKMISNVRNILGSHEIEGPTSLKKLGKKSSRNEDTVGDVVEWVSSGISLWKKFKH